MNPERNDGRTISIMLLVGFGLRLLLAWSGLAERGLVAGDAYYYFTIARNMAHGLGPTFDTLSPSNGFHPLWLLMLVPIFAFVGQTLWIPVRLALSISSVFDIASGWLIFSLLRDKGMRSEGLTAASIWLLCPFTVLLGLRGMEISLSVLIILLLIKYLAASETSLINLRHSLLAGFLVGLSGWARTDNLPTIGLTLSVILFWRGGGTIIRRFIWILTAGITALITIFPWLAWNYTHFGQIFQISGFGKLQNAWSYKAIAGEMTSLRSIIGTLAHTILVPITYPAKFSAGEESGSTAVSVFIILAVCILIVWLVLRLRKLRDIASNTLPETVISFAAIYIILHVLMYGIVIRFYAVWYALPFYAMLCILIGISLSPTAKSAQKQTAFGKAAIAASIILSVAIYAIFLVKVPFTNDSPEGNYGTIFQSISREFPQGATIGAFDAGAAGYIAPEFGKLIVVNLDMLVNNKGYDEFKKGLFLDYIANTIDVFIDDPHLAEKYLTPEETEILCALYAKDESSGFWRKFILEVD